MMRTLFRATLLLGTAAALVLAVKSSIEVIDVSPVVRSQTGTQTPKPQPVVRASVPELASLSETRERPLFAINRRPPVAQSAEAPASKAPSISLVGLLHPPAAPGRALLRVDGRHAKWVDVGATIDGYTVQEVRSGLAIMERDGRSYELRLQRKSASAERP